MKTTEQVAVLRLLTEQQIAALMDLPIDRRIAARYTRLRQLHAAATMILSARLDGVFEVVR